MKHLPPQSHVKLTKICDACDKEVPGIPYRDIMKCRNASGKDMCRKCGTKEMLRKRTMRRVNSGDNLAFAAPELAQEWHLTMNCRESPETVVPNSHYKAWWVCSDCRHEWQASVYARMGGTGCPVCRKSRGERRIYKFLQEQGVAFETQVSYDGLIGIGGCPLLFDFVVGEVDNPRLVIEYDGEQHFRPVIFGENSRDPIEQFDKVREHDRRKNEWCVNLGVPILRIKYSDFENIEAIVSDAVAEDMGVV